jgi:hypothetical protein
MRKPKLPPSDQVLAQIRACRTEMAALKKLFRAAKAAEEAAEARRQRHELGKSGELCGAR